MTGINDNYDNHGEIASLLIDGLICFCRSNKGITNDVMSKSIAQHKHVFTLKGQYVIILVESIQK